MPQDFVMALMWYTLAAAKHPPFSFWRDNLAKRMTPEQIAEAQKLAREWWATFEKRKGK